MYKMYSRCNSGERHSPEEKRLGLRVLRELFRYLESAVQPCRSTLEAVPRAYRKHWDHRTVMKGLLLQPRLVEIRDSVSDNVTATMGIGRGGKSAITPRAADEILQDLQYLDEQRDFRKLVKDAIEYLDLHDGNSTRCSSPPPPSTTFFDSNDGSYSNNLSTSDSFTEFSELPVLFDENVVDVSRLCQEKLLDNPNQHVGLEHGYGFWASPDDNLLYAPYDCLDQS